MSDKLRREIVGEIKWCNLSKVNKWGKYSFHIEGYFRDTKDPVNQNFNSKFPIRVFEGGNDPIDPKETDNLRFEGRVLVEQVEFDDNPGKPYFFPKAISIEKRIEQMEPRQEEDEGNPFLQNPLTND